jgi:tetratricopeptide (TPR) repeat protein
MATEAAADARELEEEGIAAERSGAPDEALRCYTAALDELGDEVSPLRADLLRRMAGVHRDLGNLAEAETLCYRSLDAAESAEYGAGRARGIYSLAVLGQHRGMLERAVRLFAEAARLAEAHGEVRVRAKVQHRRAMVAELRGNLDAALQECRIAVAEFEALRDPCGTGDALHTLGRIHLAAGRDDEARDGCARALATARERGDPVRMAEAMGLTARLHARCARLDEALAALDEARALAAVAGDVRLSAELLRDAGDVWSRSGERERAREAWGGALRRFAEMGARGYSRDVEGRLAAPVAG